MSEFQTISKLNTTGSCWKSILQNEVEYQYNSYGTSIAYKYNDIRFFNNTFYSMTTRKHQGIIRIYVNTDIELNHQRKGLVYNKADIIERLSEELSGLNYELKEFLAHRMTKKNKERIKNNVLTMRKINKLINGGLN